jgi:hypothetical protein
MRRPTQLELDAVGYSIGVEPGGYWTPEHGDPNWTPQKGAAHAHELMRILAEHDRRREAARSAA